MTDIARLRALHRISEPLDYDGWPANDPSCTEDGDDWPCETTALLDEVERLRAAARYVVDLDRTGAEPGEGQEWVRAMDEGIHQLRAALGSQEAPRP